MATEQLREKLLQVPGAHLNSITQFPSCFQAKQHAYYRLNDETTLKWSKLGCPEKFAWMWKVHCLGQKNPRETMGFPGSLGFPNSSDSVCPGGIWNIPHRHKITATSGGFASHIWFSTFPHHPGVGLSAVAEHLRCSAAAFGTECSNESNEYTYKIV